jgi:outer membrane protein assembly factor BamB
MHAPAIFCPTCGRYLGAADVCIFCGWTRPAGMRIPAAGAALWRLSTPAPADGCPLLARDVVVLADRTGALAGVSPADASGAPLRWHWPGDGPLRLPLAGQRGQFYAARREGDLLRLDLTSRRESGSPLLAEEGPRVRWRFPLSSPGAPAADEQRIYLGDGEGTVRALTDAGGRAEAAWSTSVGGRVALAPVRWRHLLLVATGHAQGHLVALDAARGMPIWSQPLGARAAALLLPFPRRGGAGGEVIVLTDRGLARGFRLPDGEPLDWTCQVAGGAAAGDDGAIYLAGAGGHVIALDPATGATRRLADLGDPVIGLAAWQGLLYVAARRGVLHLFDAADGVEAGRWDAGRPLTAAPAVVEGIVLVGDEAGWTALPWHLGRWDWAAARLRAWGRLEAAAACHALAGEPDAAEQAWLAAGAAERAAWFWTGLGDDRRAAAAFRRAAEAERARQPALAAAYLNQAADRLEACGEPTEAEACRQLAGRMGRFPHLRLALVNIGATEAGEPMAAAIEVRNLGNAPAEGVRFRLGGRLAHSVAGELPGPLPTGAATVLEFQELIPVAAGRQRLTVSVTCGGERGPAGRADASFEFDVAAPPPGAITVRDDAGTVIVRVPEGAALPRVRVGGMVGMVKVEVV